MVSAIVCCRRMSLLAYLHSSPISSCPPTIARPSFRFPEARLPVSPQTLCPRRTCFPVPSRVFCSQSDVCNNSNDSATTSTISVSPPSLDGVPLSQGVDAIRDAASALDIRVGRILKAWRHPEADTLYVEEVDVGEPEPRTICSGLVRFVSLEDLQGDKRILQWRHDKKEVSCCITNLQPVEGRNVIVLANLKPRNMRGVKSNGMLLAASDAQHEHVELLSPPEGSIPGERIWFGVEEEKHEHSEVATPNQVQKKKIWETVQPHLKTTDSCEAVLGTQPMRTSAGIVVCKSLKNGNVA